MVSRWRLSLSRSAPTLATLEVLRYATAEASFSAAYGYDVRGEVFGSEGMVSIGDTARTSLATAHPHRPAGRDRAR